MATYSIPLSNPVGTAIFVDTASAATAQLITASAGIVYSVDVDNSNNSDAVFTKLYNKATAASVGTDAPDLQVRTPGGGRLCLSYGGEGVAFGTGISVATTTAGGTSDTSAPTNNVIVKVHI